MTPDRTERTAETLARFVEEAVVHNRIGQWLGLLAALLLALTAAATAGDVIF